MDNEIPENCEKTSNKNSCYRELALKLNKAPICEKIESSAFDIVMCKIKIAERTMNYSICLEMEEDIKIQRETPKGYCLERVAGSVYQKNKEEKCRLLGSNESDCYNKLINICNMTSVRKNSCIGNIKRIFHQK